MIYVNWRFGITHSQTAFPKSEVRDLVILAGFFVIMGKPLALEDMLSTYNSYIPVMVMADYTTAGAGAYACAGAGAGAGSASPPSSALASSLLSLLTPLAAGA